MPQIKGYELLERLEVRCWLGLLGKPWWPKAAEMVALHRDNIAIRDSFDGQVRGPELETARFDKSFQEMVKFYKERSLLITKAKLLAMSGELVTGYRVLLDSPEDATKLRAMESLAKLIGVAERVDGGAEQPSVIEIEPERSERTAGTDAGRDGETPAPVEVQLETSGVLSPGDP